MKIKVHTKKDVNVYKGKKSFNVIEINDEKDVLAQYSSKDVSQEEMDEFDELRKELYANEAIGSTEQEVNNPPPNSSQRNVNAVEGETIRRCLMGELSVLGPSNIKRLENIVVDEGYYHVLLKCLVD